MNKIDDRWNSGDPYEYFMGRWSKLMAPVFLNWLDSPMNLSWLDLGCGTGALSEAINEQCNPELLSCIDPSPAFLQKAKERLAGEADFAVGSAENIPKADGTYDIIVSGLALNFFPDLPAALVEMKRVVKSNGTVAAYVWDYADRMDFLRLFWDVACELNPEACKLDEGVRFPVCNAIQLTDTFQRAGFSDVSTAALDINTVFESFDDYWQPFLGGQGPAPSYVTSLGRESQEELKKTLYERMPIQSDGLINLLARAIAVRGVYKP